MGLPALEFSDCYLDSPQFRDRLRSHELELDKTNKFIKELIKDGKALIQALKCLSTAKRKFADSLNDFKFQCIGDAETDDEICIAKSLQEFAAVLQNLEDERTRMIENANDVLITPLERFRKEQISAAKEAKKKYDKETEKYCAVLEKHLSLSAKKKESHLHEADNQVDHVRQHFYEVSLEYVFKVQEVQERKMFDFVEPLLAFLQGLFTYYHHGYELAKDFNHFKTDLTISIQNTRNRFESTRSEVESLMRKMKENPHEHKSVSQHTMEGYLFVLEKLNKWVYNLNRDNQTEAMAQLDVTGFNIMKKFIYAVETRGIGEQGLYRIVGVNSKVQKLLSLAMDPKTCADVELDNPEWEIKTITSAIKFYLRMLPAPLMTYQYQRSFIKAAKMDNPEARVKEIHALVHRLPEKNRQMLEMLMKHLNNVASHHQQNLMTVANLGVVFGPTLLRPQEETVAAIMDIKFQNIVVEILIEHHEKIFRDVPSSTGNSTNMQPEPMRRTSTDSKPPSCSERPLTLFHTPTHSQKGEKRNSVGNTDLQPPASSSANCNSSSSSSSSTGSNNRTPRHSLTSNDGEQDSRQVRPSSLLNPKSRGSIPTIAASPSPTSPRSPSWPMFSAPSSPQPVSSASSDSSPVSITGRKARALYACKAEHDSELSFIAGTVFENVHASREPGWLEGTLDGRTGLIPENYVEFL
ncbi:PREDICTED: rho GTPase-activating protein 26-like [Cyprinodon variegatus]|uniref:rho GTPase-activating protein 26-like n=1 Tax=Cyprinodon variegatus TaxID=28743 RepID=UPI000742C418|nr:PREDICTED: rho GTPase-activating protein 26-like [Cyprinodon variegatus]